jgi:uncharacterized membrane protein YoaK (UPF0700 family)
MQGFPADVIKAVVALAVTLVAGFVDIVGYLAIYHIFTAHVTGTTVHLGRDLASRDWAAAAMTGTVVAGFLLGSVVGRAVIEAGARLHFRRVASINIAAETALLVLFVPLSKLLTFSNTAQEECALLALLALAMGLQTATLTRIGALTIHTTFVTGMINKLAQLLSHVLFYTYDVLRAASPADKTHYQHLQHASARQASFFFSIWVTYLVGSVLGTLLYFQIGVRSMYIPAFLLVLTIVTDQFKPLSLQEERDVPER